MARYSRVALYHKVQNAAHNQTNKLKQTPFKRTTVEIPEAKHTADPLEERHHEPATPASALPPLPAAVNTGKIEPVKKKTSGSVIAAKKMPKKAAAGSKLKQSPATKKASAAKKKQSVAKAGSKKMAKKAVSSSKRAVKTPAKKMAVKKAAPKKMASRKPAKKITTKSATKTGQRKSR